MTMQEFQLEIEHHLIQIESFLKQVKPGYKLAQKQERQGKS